MEAVPDALLLLRRQPWPLVAHPDPRWLLLDVQAHLSHPEAEASHEAIHSLLMLIASCAFTAARLAHVCCAGKRCALQMRPPPPGSDGSGTQQAEKGSQLVQSRLVAGEP